MEGGDKERLRMLIDLQVKITKLKGLQKKTPITVETECQAFTLIWYTGCILFFMQSSTIRLTCFKPLNEPIAATVFPYTYQRKNIKPSFLYSPLYAKEWEQPKNGGTSKTTKNSNKLTIT